MLSGYLTPNSFVKDIDNVILKIPNYEICNNLTKMRDRFFINNFSNRNQFLNDIIEERLDLLEKDYQTIALDCFSYYDTEKRKGESFYHGFTLCLLYLLGINYKVVSNRESGFGKSDIIVTKKDKTLGYIFELKEAIRKQDLEKEAKEGLKQIDVKQYEKELKDIKKIYKIAIAFSGKNINVLYK